VTLASVHGNGRSKAPECQPERPPQAALARLSEPPCNFESRSKKLDTLTNKCSNEYVRVCGRAPSVAGSAGCGVGKRPARPTS
jgi:hypothetical protein